MKISLKLTSKNTQIYKLTFLFGLGCKYFAIRTRIAILFWQCIVGSIRHFAEAKIFYKFLLLFKNRFNLLPFAVLANVIYFFLSQITINISTNKAGFQVIKEKFFIEFIKRAMKPFAIFDSSLN